MLNKPVSKLPKIGPKTSKLLNNLGIKTVDDLIYHFPFRYEDYSKVKNIAELKNNETCTVKARLVKANNIFTKNRKRLTTAQIEDLTGKTDIIWFNQHFILKTLKVGEEYFIRGKVGTFNKKLVFYSPTLELVDADKAGESGEDSSSTMGSGKLVPIYPETKGLTSKWISSRLADIKSLGIFPAEFIPQEILDKQSFLQLPQALTQIHFPQKLTQAADAKRRLAFDELFLELLRVEKQKQLWKKNLQGTVLNAEAHTTEIKNLEDSLPFKLSPSQKAAIEQIFKDCSKKHPMNRLLEGDVGTGKTIVAIMAAYNAYLNGYKTLYMAPTAILADQHFKTFQSILGDFGVKVVLKTSTNRINLDEEEFDIVVGTHALLFTEKQIDKVGLVVIDEQHRFGVKQRAKLAKLTASTHTPNVLTMTATPIPRTLALTIYGDLEISLLQVPKVLEKIVVTKVIPENKRIDAFKWIKRKNQPTFIVCPFIEESNHEAFENVKAAQAEYEKLKNGIFSDTPIGLLHGKMKPAEKQAVVDDFKNGKIQVLISTPVIEVGIDIPEATIIVIESAERYGLASLHQLRGRVGRGGDEAFCMLFQSNFSKKSYSRLKNLEEVSDGIKLAEIDLEYRGQGDVYGTMQSGFKNFKLATLGDLELLEVAKNSAERYFDKLEEFPKLKSKLDDLIESKLIGQN